MNNQYFVHSNDHGQTIQFWEGVPENPQRCLAQGNRAAVEAVLRLYNLKMLPDPEGWRLEMKEV